MILNILPDFKLWVEEKRDRVAGCVGDTEMKYPDLSNFTPEAQQLWSAWDIRAYVLLSLLIQCLLVSCASEKKRTNKGWLVTLISVAYYLADWIAPYAIGMILGKQVNSISCDPDNIVKNGDLMAFWASFLLLHLGGPDNVTSLSTDENYMWTNKLSVLFTHIGFIFTIYTLSLPINSLFSASLMVFLAGAIKSAERLLSMYFASWKTWKTFTLVMQRTYEKLFATQLAMQEANLPTQVESMKLLPKKFKPYNPILRDVELKFDTANDPLDGRSLLQFGWFFYDNFRYLFTDHWSYSDVPRQFTRDFFLRRSSYDAFKLAEIELNFVHEELHTKALKEIPFTRVVTLTLIAAASSSFLLFDKRGWSKIDIGVSYVMLFGTFVLEIVSFLMVMCSCRRTAMYVCHYLKPADQISKVEPVANAIVEMRMWSNSISKCNLIRYCLRYRTPLSIRTIPEIIHIWFLYEGKKLKRDFTSDTISESFKGMIFGELCTRSKLAHNLETAKMIGSQRGDWALMQWSCYSQLKWSLGGVEYGHSLLLWHIATDLLCYNTKDYDHNTSYSKRRFCEEISGYLLYLLIVKPTMIALVAGNWVKKFWDTSLEAERLFHKRSITDHEQACEAIISVDTDIEPVILKGDASASVLFDACRLAKQLKVFEEEKRWSLMSSVWMELLTYAAFHCEGPVHAQNPSQGGELLTFVWLLMNHLGLGKQFHEKPARTRYRVAVKK